MFHISCALEWLFIQKAMVTWRLGASQTSKKKKKICQMTFFDVELTILGTNWKCESLIHFRNEFGVMQYIYDGLTLLCCGYLISQHVVLSFFQISGKPIRSPSRPEFPWRARSIFENAGRTCAKSGDNSWKGWTVHRFRIIAVFWVLSLSNLGGNNDPQLTIYGDVMLEHKKGHMRASAETF